MFGLPQEVIFLSILSLALERTVTSLNAPDLARSPGAPNTQQSHRLQSRCNTTSRCGGNHLGNDISVTIILQLRLRAKQLLTEHAWHRRLKSWPLSAVYNCIYIRFMCKTPSHYLGSVF